LALALVMMIVVAPILKLKNLVRRWTNRHVPVVIEADDYEEVVRHLEKILDRTGTETTRGRAELLLRVPTRVFSLLAGSSSDQLVAKNLAALRGDGFEVTVHPSDLVLRGEEAVIARLYGAINEHLAFAKVYLTWSKEANQVEDQLMRLSREINEARSIPALHELAIQLEEQRRFVSGMNLPAEEWDVLFREVLLVQQAIYRKEKSLPDPLDRRAHRPSGERQVSAARPRFDLSHAQADEHLGTAPNVAIPLVSLAATAATLGTLVWRSWRSKHSAS
jgi:hypothetical protein